MEEMTEEAAEGACQVAWQAAGEVALHEAALYAQEMAVDAAELAREITETARGSPQQLATTSSAELDDWMEGVDAAGWLVDEKATDTSGWMEGVGLLVGKGDELRRPVHDGMSGDIDLVVRELNEVTRRVQDAHLESARTRRGVDDIFQSLVEPDAF
jgi:hypothetical protein